MTRWRRIEALISESCPFIWRASRTAMTSIPLSWPPFCPSPDHRLAGGARMPPWLPGARRRLLMGLTWAERALSPIRAPRIGATEHLRRYGIGRAAEPSGALTGWQSLFMTVIYSE